jgi:hypothetical protein
MADYDLLDSTGCAPSLGIECSLGILGAERIVPLETPPGEVIR